MENTDPNYEHLIIQGFLFRASKKPFHDSDVLHNFQGHKCGSNSFHIQQISYLIFKMLDKGCCVYLSCSEPFEFK